MANPAVGSLGNKRNMTEQWRLCEKFCFLFSPFGELVGHLATNWPFPTEQHAHHDRKKFTRPRKHKYDSVDAYD